METLHIIDSRNRDQIISDYLNENQALINHRFMSFDQVFFKPNLFMNRLFQAQQLVKENLDHFELLKPALNYLENIKQALKFIDNCDKYQVNLTDLPHSTQIDAEKSKLVELLMTHIDRPYQIVVHPDQKEIIVHPQNLQLYQHDILKNFDHTLVTKPEVSGLRQYKRALNPSQEVMGLIEYLNQTKPETVTILIAESIYTQELKKQFHQQPHFEVSYLDETLLEPLHIAYLNLYKAIKHQDREELLNYLRLNLFNDPQMKAYLEIIDLYNFSFEQLLTELPNINHDFSSLFSYQLKHQKEKYELAREFSKTLQLRFELIDSEHLIESLFNLFTTLPNQTNALYSLKQKLEENSDVLNQEDFLEEILLQPRSKKAELKPIVVADLSFQDSRDVDLVVMLGMSQQNFPNFISETGLYNEDYISKLSEYPSLETRIEHHMDQLMTNLTTAKNLIISHPMINYQGKPYQTSFEIESWLNIKKANLWEFTQSEGLGSTISDIHPTTAQTLFTQNGIVKGSVTTLETYTKNSFRYFLERGLGLRVSQPFDLDIASIGTLTHKVMEVLIRNKDKNYVNSTKEEIKTILQPTFDELIHFYPHLKDHYEVKLNRLTHQLYLNLNNLKHYENNAGFRVDPNYLEYRFNNLQLYDDVPLLISGVIDRIDTNNNGFLVIDYKSSDKKIPMDDVYNGQQLQLLTYALVGQRLLQQVCLGAFYYSFSVKLDGSKPYSIGTRDGLKFTTTGKAPFVLEGKLFRKIDTTDYFGRRGTISLEALDPYFNELFKLIVTQISTGILSNYLTNMDYFEFADLQRSKETYSKIPELSSQLKNILETEKEADHD